VLYQTVIMMLRTLALTSGNAPDYVVRGSRIESDSCVYHDSYCDIHSHGHGLSSLTAVPGSTQPSTYCGKVKFISAFGLNNNNNNNKLWWWMWTIVAYRGARLAWS